MLEIERGRYQRPNPQPADQRFCPSGLQLCRKLVEDEFHFLMSCDTYEEERSQLFNVATAHIPSFQEHVPESQFVLLICCVGNTVVLQLAQYVYVCMCKREVLLH